MTPMTRSEVLDLVAQARASNHRPDLQGADLRGVDLQGADLRGAYLRGANLRYAYLRGANLRSAYLWGVDLWGADLRDVDLRDAYGKPAVLAVTGLPSGAAILVPWPDGWELRVGRWYGTPDSLAELIATDEGWPEATGEECARQRPLLEALIVLCRAWIDAHPDAIAVAVASQAEGERIRAEARNE